MKNLLFLLCFLPVSLFSQIHYVKMNGTGDGTSWTNARGDLKQALLDANSGDTIWIADGVYFPTSCTNCSEADREETFLVTNTITILGGFPNTGEPTLNDRNWEMYSTVLSGAIGMLGDDSDNSFHVITVDHNNGNVKIDGIYINDGNADIVPNIDGGGLICYSCTENDGLNISNCSFSNNTANDKGGAYFSTGPNDYIYIDRCRFENNMAFLGGAVYTDTSNSTLKNCWFSNNEAKQGGAIYTSNIYASNKKTKLLGCTFYQNKAIEGGAFYVDEINSDPNYSDPKLVFNCTFAENSGSAVFFKYVEKKVYLYNNIFWDNLGYGVEVADYDIYVWDYGPAIYLGVTLTDKFTELELCNIEYSGCAYFDAPNPFVDLENGNLNLAIGSSAANVGGDESIITNNGLSIDIDGNPRVFGAIDLGAFELQTENCTSNFGNIIYVNPNAAGNNSGDSWQDAFTNLQDGLTFAANCGVDTIWVAEGLYKPTGCIGCNNANPREFSFQFPVRSCGDDILSSFILFGGFPASGNPDMNDRDWENYPTIFSGNIGNLGTNSDNVYHIIKSGGQVILDGLIIQDGYANGDELNDQNGAAILATDDVQLYNCIVKNNYALGDGGAIYTLNGEENVFQNCTIFNNEAGRNGGAFFNGYIDPRQTGGKYFEGKITISESTIRNNTAGYDGGAIHCTSVNFYNCIVKNNTAGNRGGAFYTEHHKNKNTLSNTEFLNNSAYSGGAGFIYGKSNSYNTNGYAILESEFTMSNCIFSQNTAQSRGGALIVWGAEKTNINRCVFDHNQAIEGIGALEIRALNFFEPDYSLIFKRCTFAFNTSEEGANALSILNQNLYEDPLSFKNHLFWGNHTPTNRELIEGEFELAYCLFDQSNCNEVGFDISCGENMFFDAPDPFADSENDNYELNDSTLAIDNGYGSADIGAYPYESPPDSSSCNAPNIFLSSQNEVDSFAWNYPGLTEIECSLIISGEEDDDILNLNGLSGITSIGGNLIINDNFSLNDLSGLENLEIIGGSLSIKRGLINLTGLENLQSIGGGLAINDCGLLNLNELSSLTSLGGSLSILSNEDLETLDGLQNLESIGESLILSGNEKLMHVNALNNLTSIGKDLIIRYNDDLSQIDSLQNLDIIEGNVIFDNQGLSNLVGLQNIQSIGKDFSVFNSLSSLSGLENLQSIGRDFTLQSTYISNIESLESLASIGGSFKIIENNSLQNLNGLNNLEIIERHFKVEENESLISIEGLESLSSIGADLLLEYNDSLVNLEGLGELSSIGRHLNIFRNDQLVNLNGLENLEFIGGKFNVENNKSIINLNGLESLSYTVGDFSIIYNKELLEFTQFPQLSAIGGSLLIGSNEKLINLDGLSNLDTIGMNLRITFNDSLVSIQSLTNISYIGNDFFIRANSLLTTMPEFSGLTNIPGRLYISSILSDLTCFSNLSSVGREVDIKGISSLTGLENLISIGGYLNLADNYLISLEGLESLESIGNGFYLSGNHDLTILDGINSLNYIEGDLSLYNNSSLEDISILNVLNPHEIDNLRIGRNDSLSVCAENFVCNYLNLQKPSKIYNNAAGCYNKVEVVCYCENEDLDGDGYPLSEDCDDMNAAINPDATEIPNNDIDENCDGYIAQDADNDGFWDDVDCDDNNADINPDAIEIIYNGLDDDCNPATLDDDLDQDGFVFDEDCDDSNPDINPDAEEIPNNGIDEDCDGEDLIVSLNDLVSSTVKIFPNPTKDVLYFKSETPIDYIQIFNVFGQLVLERSGSYNLEMLDVKHLAPGVYLIGIMAENRLLAAQFVKM